MADVEIWLLHYGSIAIFFLLALGIIGLPIPDETIIVLAGVLVTKGKMPLVPTLIAIYGGALLGITMSYMLGYTWGHYLVERWGKYIGITRAKIERAEQWFKAIGKWVLFLGYFVMGIRHLSGLVAGMMKLPYRQFALFAYSGLLIWASSLFAIGYSFRYHWQKPLHYLTFIGIIVALLAFIVIYFVYYRQRKKRDSSAS